MFDGKRQPVVYILASPNRRAIYVGVTTIAREKQIKNWRREKKVALIDSINPEWEDLAPDASI